jgi:cell division protein FtsZ
VMTLGMPEPQPMVQPVLQFGEREGKEEIKNEIKAEGKTEVEVERPQTIQFVLDEPEIDASLAPTLVELQEEPPVVKLFDKLPVENPVEKQEPEIEKLVLSSASETTDSFQINNTIETSAHKEAVVATSASGGYLAKPSNIYASEKTEFSKPIIQAEEQVPVTTSDTTGEALPELKLVIRDEEIPAADGAVGAHQTQPEQTTAAAEELALQDEAEEQKRRAAERLHKLRNLSFNINSADPNNEFETVPAYIRRNMELYNTISSVEDFYSNYTVKKDENDQTQISTINTFLDGEKPD